MPAAKKNQPTAADNKRTGKAQGAIRRRLLAFLIAAAGIAMMLYPWISNLLYDNATEASVEAYEDELADASAQDLYSYWADAREYNENLLHTDVVLTDPFTYENVSLADGLGYENMLDMGGTGVMCYVEIPKIDVYIPVYHNTSDESLSKGAGHMEGTALPVGTVGGRPIISAHTGINTAKMFSDLTKMEEGDLFFIHVLDAVYAYRVVEVLVIEPDDISSLSEDPDRDLVTLLTCTPYGINSHRLIVTGERTKYTESVIEEAEASSANGDTEWMQAYKEAMSIGIAIIAAFVALALIVRTIRRRARRRKNGPPGCTGSS